MIFRNPKSQLNILLQLPENSTLNPLHFQSNLAPHPVEHLHDGTSMSALQLSAGEELEMFSAGTESATVTSTVKFRI
jgi:hypothetical protein